MGVEQRRIFRGPLTMGERGARGVKSAAPPQALLACESLEPLILREISGDDLKSVIDPVAARYLALTKVFLDACDELFEEIAHGIRDADEHSRPAARQASVMRLTYLRAEIDGCDALRGEVAGDCRANAAGNGASGSGEDSELHAAKVLALVRTASHVLSKTLSTCSFLLSEDAAVDPLLVNRALVFFAKLSTLFGAAGNPGVQNQRLAEFIGLRSPVV